MADIELRAYVAEIEEMLAAEKNDEAVAHCRHILDYYPKNLAVYRLLGKGLLEQRRFGDAADIFYRVLSVAPDDFVAHVGLAIVGEEEGNLPRAVGHMERAFEAQSNNAAIHAELRRLYGRRDGVEPERVWLTRGALARLYIQGGNYAQAVDELQAALQEDPERIDLQVLLAKALWKDEQRIDAVEVCQEVLARLSVCLEINAILYEIWQSTGRDEEAITFWRNVEVVDPYLAHEIRSREDTIFPPDLEIPRLDYVPPTPDEVMGIPEWVHDLGLSFEGEARSGARPVSGLEEAEQKADWPELDAPGMPDLEEEAAPGWLRDIASSVEQDESALELGLDWAESDEDDAVPDWLRDAGVLGPSDETAVHLDQPGQDGQHDAADGDDADVPDWLADMVTAGSEVLPAGDQLMEEASKAHQELAVEGAAESQIPAADELVGDLPDWLQAAQQEFDASVEEGQDASTVWVEPAGDRLEEGSLFDELGARSGPPDEELPPSDAEAVFPFDWQLEGDSLGFPEEDEFGLRDQAVVTTASSGIEESDMVHGDKELGTPGDMDELEDLLSDPDSALAWLEQLAADEGAPLEELTTIQARDIEQTVSPELDEQPPEIPDWLKEELTGQEAEGVAEMATAEAEDIQIPTDPEEAMAWLEQLAAEQETPVEKAELELDEPELPDWVTPQPAFMGAKEEIEGEKEFGDMPEDVGEAMAWLEKLAARQETVADAAPTKPLPEAELPPWLEQEYEVAEPAEAEQMAVPVDESELPEWLRALAPEPAARAEPELSELDDAELPEWLRGPAVESPAPAAEAPLAELPVELEKAELPEWLRDLQPREPISEQLPPPVEVAPAGEAEELELAKALFYTDELVTTRPAAEADLSPEVEDELPEWLRAAQLEAELDEVEQVLPDLEPVSRVQEPELPEWLRMAGAVEELAPAAAEPVAQAEETELPEWLQTEAVEEELVPAESKPVAQVDEIELPEWLQEEDEEELVPAEPKPVAQVDEIELPEWLQAEAVEEELVPVEPEPVAQVDEIELPEWLQVEDEEELVLAESEPVAQVDEIELPEWLRAAEDEAVAARPEDVELPEWLQAEKVEEALIPAELEPVDQGDEIELPEWLRATETELFEAEEELPSAIELEPEAIVEEPDLSEWLKEPQVELPEPELPPAVEAEVPELVAEAQPQVSEPELDEPDMFEWLQQEEPDAVAFEMKDGVEALPDAAHVVDFVEDTPPVEEPVAELASEPAVVVADDYGAWLSEARGMLQADQVREGLGKYADLVATDQELEAVADDLGRFVEANPDNLTARRLLGDTFMRRGNLEQALAEYRQALSRL